MAMQTHYSLLGVSETARPDEIIRAYKDRHGELVGNASRDDSGDGIERKIRALEQARQVLTNEASRDRYDASLRRMRQGSPEATIPGRHQPLSEEDYLPEPPPEEEDAFEIERVYVPHVPQRPQPATASGSRQWEAQPGMPQNHPLSRIQRRRARSLAYGMGLRFFEKLILGLYIVALAAQALYVQADRGAALPSALPYFTVLVPLVVGIIVAIRWTAAKLAELLNLSGEEIDRLYESHKSAQQAVLDVGLGLFIIVVLFVSYTALYK